MLFDTVQLSWCSPTIKYSAFYFNDLLLLFFEIRQAIDCDDSPPLAQAIDTSTEGILFEYYCKFLVANINIFVVKNRLFENKRVIW